MGEEDSKVARLTRWQRIGFASLLVVGAFVLSAVVFILSGVYNIGASRQHWSVTNTLLTIVRDRSISVAANGIDVPDLTDPDLVSLGRQHFRGGCSSCHGMPGEQNNPIYQNMLPSPPDLVGAFEDYSAAEVFWIVYNGLKFTGMPAWPGQDRTDEVWSLVAYLRQVNAEQGDRSGLDDSVAVPPRVDATGLGQLPLENCVRCHGDGDTAPISSLVPSLNGLTQAYLERALREYRIEIRASGIMEPIAHELTETELVELSRYYAELEPVLIRALAPAETLLLGEEIAHEGLAEYDVPACTSCHNGARPQIPQLAGQAARYMATQLDLWRNKNYRDDTDHGSLMARIARRLSADQARAVSEYYATLPRQPVDMEVVR